MNKEFMMSHHITPVVKRKRTKDNSDVRVRIGNEMRKGTTVAKGFVILSKNAYRKAFKESYLSFGFDSKTSRLYMWDSDNVSGFKLVRYTSDIDSSGYTCSSTDLVNVLSNFSYIVDAGRTGVNYELRYDTQANCYYIQLSEREEVWQ